MPIAYGQKRIQALSDISFEGRRVFLRVDLNVPIESGEVKDQTRIQAVIPTVRALLSRGALLTIASHLGRPKGRPNPTYSMEPVGGILADVLKRDVIIPDDCIGDAVRKLRIDQVHDQVILLENLRFHAEEEKNDVQFAEDLKGNAEIFVTDAFGALHRAHASTDALPRLFETKAVGLLVEKELNALSPLLSDPPRPFVVILGGAKVSDKIKVIERLFRTVNEIFLGGAMVFTFLRAMGRDTGRSLVEEDFVRHAERLIEEARKRNVRLHFPSDFAVGASLENPGAREIVQGFDIPDDRMGLDIGPATIADFSEKLRRARTVFWNGPMGLFEKKPFDDGTIAIAKALAELSAVTIVGGGDSAAAVAQAGVSEKMTHISTGGGATLEYLEGKLLPGLESLTV